MTAEVMGDTLYRCGDSTGFVTITNTGSEGIRIAGIELRDGDAGMFRLDLPVVPFTLPSGGTHRIPVTFIGLSPGGGEVAVLVSLRSADGTIDLGVIETRLVGIDEGITASVSIGRGYRGKPGERIVAEVMLDASLDDADVTELTLSLTYDRMMLLLDNIAANGLARMLAGTRLEGWSIIIQDVKPGSFRARFTAPPGETLRGAGTLLKLEFRTYLSSVMSSELPFTLSAAGRSCVIVNSSPGLVQLDSICGLRYRLIELIPVSYSLDANRPNPFNPSTTIEFSVGLDARTTMMIRNAAGQLVATLLDEDLVPGRYQVVWDASAHPSGLYYCTISSGPWSRGMWMTLVK
jgi:hypothetical protein